MDVEQLREILCGCGFFGQDVEQLCAARLAAGVRGVAGRLIAVLVQNGYEFVGRSCVAADGF
jgi:hypothetical protein